MGGGVSLPKQVYKSTLTGNISPCRKVSGCGQTHRRSSTSARWHDHSRGPYDQLCRRCSTAAPSPFWAPCSPGKCGHSYGSCSMLYKRKVWKRISTPWKLRRRWNKSVIVLHKKNTSHPLSTIGIKKGTELLCTPSSVWSQSLAMCPWSPQR